MTHEHRTHALYRFYAADGALLYVGITNNPGNRLGQHAQDKPWWHEVRGISVEPYDDRASALAAETRAIAVENPRYNKARPSLPGRKRSKTTTAPRLVWICDTCLQPVADGRGYIHVSHVDVGQVRTWWREHDRQQGDSLHVNLDDLASMPEPARWQVHHGDCDPNPDSPDYHFDVARARTHAQLLHWTAHLMGKGWLRHTDWDELIDRMSTLGDGGRQ